MRLFYDPSSGEIIGTIDGFSDDPRLDNATMTTSSGVVAPQVNIHLGHPLEQMARDLEDVKHSLQIHDLVMDGGNPREKTKPEKDKRDKKIADQKAANEAWRKAHPPVTMDDLMKQVQDLQNRVGSQSKNVNPN